MAADHKKQLASDGIEENSTRVGDGGQKKGPGSLLTWFKRNKKLVLLSTAAIILVAGWLYFGLHVGQKVYAQAAGHKVYKSEIDDIRNGKNSITEHQAAVVLADKYLTQAMAKDHGVKVTEADIVKAYGPTVEEQKKSNPYAYQNAVNQLYFVKLNANNQGNYKGKLLVANFSRNVPYDSALLPEKKAANPNLGNPAAIAADKKYAKDFITNLYNQVTSGKMSFDQAMQEERANPVVGEKAYVTQDHSGSFDGPVSQINLLNTDAVHAMLATTKAGTTTKPFVVRIPASIFNNSTTEGYYLVVKLDHKSGGDSTMNFRQELAQAKKELGYKVNV